MKQITPSISKAGWFLGLLLLLTMLLTPSPLQANGFGEQEVRAAVETWVRYVTADARPDAVVERMEPYQVNGETVAYIAHLKDGGFCITGADALLLPVYFYSPRGTYDATNPGLQYILWEIGARLEHIRQDLAAKGPTVQQYQDELSERAAYWQDLIAGRVPASMESQAASAEPVKVKLDLTSQWHQGSPYNDQTPTLPGGSGNHTRVGCVATAMAQIMYYWKWPQTGVGNVSVTYKWRSTPNWITTTLAIDPNIDPARFAGRLRWIRVGGVGELQMNGDWDHSVLTSAQNITNTRTYSEALHNLWNRLPSRSFTNHSANLGLATYNWGILQDTHVPPPDPGDVEAAKLSYHAGLAAKMEYGIWASGAKRQNMVEALEKNFRFDQDATLGTRDKNIMIEEIQWLRPIGFAGRDSPTTGHVWVISGYNKGTDPWEFWMNLGWTNPTVIGWFSYDNVPRNFNNSQQHITRIAPLNVVRFVGASDSGDGTPDNPYQHIEEAITAAPSGATLIFKAGSDNTFSASTLTINRPFTLKGKDITIRKE
jgi:hypothetical protein